MAKNKKETVTEAPGLDGVPTAHPPMGQSLMGGALGLMLSTIIGNYAKMPHSDQLDFFNTVMAQFGPEAAPGEVDYSKHNFDTIKAKGSPVGESLLQAFDGAELSEEFKERATTLFDAALHARAELEKNTLREEFDTKLVEETNAIREEMEEKINQYLTYAAKEWLEENKLEVEKGLRNELVTNFIDNLRAVFAEAYIDVPEEKYDLVGALEEKVVALNAQLNEAVSKNIELNAKLDSAAADRVREEVRAGLTATQIEKFNTLAESVEFTDSADLRKKLEIIKEAHFSKNTSVAPKTESIPGVITEEDSENKKIVSADPRINTYADFLTRSVKR